MTETGQPTRRTRVLPLVGRAVAYELAMWRSLYRWTLRRPLALDPGAEAFSYAGVVTPIFGVFIGLSAIELPILHLILPWKTARLIALPLGAYGLIWMVGMLASLRVHPHIVADSGLRIRNATTVDITIPWDAIAAVRTRYRSLPPGRSIRLEQSESGPILHIAVSSQSSIDVALRQPTTVRLPKGPSEPITQLRFYADDPHALVARAREHLTADLPNSDA
jgi:hypothetical protein